MTLLLFIPKQAGWWNGSIAGQPNSQTNLFQGPPDPNGNPAWTGQPLPSKAGPTGAWGLTPLDYWNRKKDKEAKPKERSPDSKSPERTLVKSGNLLPNPTLLKREARKVHEYSITNFHLQLNQGYLNNHTYFYTMPIREWKRSFQVNGGERGIRTPGTINVRQFSKLLV